MKRPFYSAHALLVFLALSPSLLFIVGCSDEVRRPEAEVRALIAAAEEAAELKSADALSEMIHSSYEDNHAYNKVGIMRLIRLYLYRNVAIHVFTQVREIENPDPKRVNATLIIAMAGTPMKSVDDVQRLQAEIFYVDLDFMDTGDGEWQVTHANWRRATFEDIL
jgi:hypothetical protein